MWKAGSHYVVSTKKVAQLEEFFSQLFGVSSYYSSKEFAEFVLPNGFRLAFAAPVGKMGEFFGVSGERHHHSLGITVEDIESIHKKAVVLVAEKGGRLSGPPKEHPWGEMSFLLVDPDGNRWEITESPSENGMLVNR